MTSSVLHLVVDSTFKGKEIMHLKELLSHRTRIVRQVEESYDELDVLRAKKRRVDLERQNIEKEIDPFFNPILEKKYLIKAKNHYIQMSNGKLCELNVL